MRNIICSSLIGKFFSFIIKYTFIISFFVSINIYPQAPGCPNVTVGEVNTGGDATITCISNNCVDISASYLNVGATTSALDAMEIHMLSERCLVTQGANNFMLMK